MYIEKTKDWEDIGTLENYMETNKKNFNCRNFNSLFLDDFKGMFVGQIQNIHTRCVRGHIDGGVSAAYLLSL